MLGPGPPSEFGDSKRVKKRRGWSRTRASKAKPSQTLGRESKRETCVVGGLGGNNWGNFFSILSRKSFLEKISECLPRWHTYSVVMGLGKHRDGLSPRLSVVRPRGTVDAARYQTRNTTDDPSTEPAGILRCITFVTEFWCSLSGYPTSSMVGAYCKGPRGP